MIEQAPKVYGYQTRYRDPLRSLPVIGTGVSAIDYYTGYRDPTPGNFVTDFALSMAAPYAAYRFLMMSPHATRMTFLQFNWLASHMSRQAITSMVTTAPGMIVTPVVASFVGATIIHDVQGKIVSELPVHEQSMMWDIFTQMMSGTGVGVGSGTEDYV
jgi:uncharacterized protein YacL